MLAEYSVELNANGHIAGYRINSGGALSQFIVQADVFKIASQVAGGPLVSPFTVVGNTAFIAGAVIQDGTVSANKIVANSLTAGQIAADAITASEVAANAITTPKILGGAVSDETVLNFADLMDIADVAPTSAFAQLFAMSTPVALYDVSSLAQVTAEFTVGGFDDDGARISADARYRFKLQTRSSTAEAWVDRTDTHWLGIQTGGGANSAVGQSISVSYSVSDITAIMARIVYQMFSANPGANIVNIYNPRIIVSGRLR